MPTWIIGFVIGSCIFGIRSGIAAHKAHHLHNPPTTASQLKASGLGVAGEVMLVKK